MKPARTLPLALTVALSLAAAAIAQTDYTWINPDGGPYGLDTNWDPAGPPSASDHAFFTAPAGTVAFDQDYDLNQLTVEEYVEFDLDGHTWSILFDDYTDDAVVIGDWGGGFCSFHHGTINCGSITLARNDWSYGDLYLANVDWHGLLGGNWQGLTVGFAGSAGLYIADGATLRHGHMTAAARPQSHAAVEVGGPDSRFYIDGFCSFGDQGRAELFAYERAQARMGVCIMGYHPGAHAAASIAGAGSLSPETRWELANSGETSLCIARQGSAQVTVAYRGQLLCQGPAVIGQYPGSAGLLTIENQYSWADFRQSLAIGGDLTEQGGRGAVLVRDFANLSVAADGGELTVWPLGKLKMDYGHITCGTYTSIRDLNLWGELSGNGTMFAHLNNLTGVLSIAANYAGSIEIEGSYRQFSDANLEIQIVDEEYGPWCTWLTVNGPATLDGRLDVTLPDGFVPRPEDIFEFIYADSITGRFTNALDTYTCQAGTFDVVYESGRVYLHNFSPLPACVYPSPADFNRDCVVDLYDYARFANDWLLEGLILP